MVSRGTVLSGTYGAPDTVLVFISHSHNDRQTAMSIKRELEKLGIESFVAHEDIEPMKEWRVEIERALQSMDLLIALLSDNFSYSNWTDQEVGAAIGRQVPIIPVRMGRDPYGFMDKYQAIRGSDGNRAIAEKTFQHVFDRDELRSKATDAFTLALATATSFDEARRLAPYLPKIQTLSVEQEASLIDAVNGNNQIWKCYEFNPAFQTSEPLSDEFSLPRHLKRLTGKDYWFRKQGEKWILDCLPF